MGMSPAYSLAGLDGLVKYAKRHGAMSNINKGQVFASQRAGYITGGSIINRGPRPEELTPLQVQLPNFDLGPCTGSFDMRFGGLSYLRGQEFARFFKNVAHSVPAFMVKMAITEVSPVIADLMTYLETVARDINGKSINQCAMTQAIVNGGLAALNNSKKQHYMMRGNLAGGHADLQQVLAQCNVNAGEHAGYGEDKELKSLLGDEFNLVWKALSQGDNAGSSRGLKELMMAVTGSVISSKEQGEMSFRSLPSLIEKEDLLEQYIGRPGGASSKVKLYQCDTSAQCLYPSEVEEMLSAQDTIYGNVSRLLLSLTEKIEQNKGAGISDEEQALVEFSSIPLINLIEIELSMKKGYKGSMLVNTSEFIEVVCYDLITSFMQQLLIRARSAVQALGHAQLDEAPIKEFMGQVELVQSYLCDKRFMAFKKLQIITQVKERLNQQIKVFELGFTRFLQGNKE